MGENHTVLLRYKDSDGDHLCIAHDPLPDDPEDIWIGVEMDDGRIAMVRVPLGALRGALQEVPE